jgi:hypothetical protein
VRKKDGPAIADPFVEIDFSLRGFGSEIGGFVVDAQHSVDLLTCRIKAGIRAGNYPETIEKSRIC